MNLKQLLFVLMCSPYYSGLCPFSSIKKTQNNVIFIKWGYMLHKLAQNNKRVHNMHFTLAFVSIIYWNFPSIYELLHVEKQSEISCFTITTFHFIRKKKTNLFTAWYWDPLIDFHCCLTNCHPFFFPGNERIEMRKLIRRLLYIDTCKGVLRHRSKPKL